MDDTKALQFYYTSCRSGLSGYAGFQTYAESAGVQPDERQEFERKALYHPPRNLPHDPDAETIEALFPKAFKTFRLSSGRTALVHSVYTGQDYSGRWGNYFSHGLILDQLAQGKWPIDSYSWMGWVKGIENEEATGKLDNLPGVLVAELTTGTDFEFDELQVFLGEEEKRESTLEKMLDAVFGRKINSRNIVIREVSELDAVYWVACIQKAFPLTFQQELTCSTFQFDPRNSLAVNATLGETDFLFDDGEFNYQFYVFDFVAERQSNVTHEYNEYTHAIASWMKNKPDKLERFHQFSGLFDCSSIGFELVSILRLYRLEQGESVLFSPVEFHELLEFISVHAHPSAITRILDSLKIVSQNLKKATSIDEWELIIRSLEKVAKLTSEEKNQEEVSSAWIDAFDHFVFREQHDETTILSLRVEIEERSERIGREIAKAFLDDQHLDWMLTNITVLPAKSLAIIASQIERSCYLLGRIPSYNCQEIKSLIESVLYYRTASTEDFHWLLSAYQHDSDAIVSLVSQVLSIAESLAVAGKSTSNLLKTIGNNLGKSLSDVLISNANISKNQNFRIEVLRRLVSDIRFLDVVLSEWKSSLQHTRNERKAYDYYDDNILFISSRSADVVREVLAIELLKKLKEKEKQQQAKYWIESGRCQKFSEKFAGDILELASKEISLLPEDDYSDKLADKIHLATRSWDNQPDLHRIKLRDLIKSTLNGMVNEGKRLEQLGKLDEKLYGEYLDIVLPRMMSNAVTADSHQDMLISLIPNNKAIAIFEKIYMESINANYFDKPDESHIAIIIFWLKFNEKNKDWLKLKGIKKNAIKNLVASLASTRKRSRSGIINYLHESPEMIDCKKILTAFSKKVNESTASTSILGNLFKRS